MIIKSLELKNYRPYQEPDIIHFANGEKNITIIEGINDTGKTSLINAINWCLYNKEAFREEGKEERWNKSRVKKLNKNDKIEVKVRIIMEDEEGNDICFTRKETYVKITDTHCKLDSKSFTIYKETNGDNDKIKNPESYIKNNLPQSLQEYFIFTGEKLTQFMSKKAGVVKEGVHTLYQLDLLKNIQTQAKNREKEFSDKFKQINPELSELKEIRSGLIEQRIEDEETLEENLNEITRLKNQIETWEKEINGQDKDADELIAEKKKIEDEKEDLEKARDENEKSYFSSLIDNFSIVMSNNYINNVITKWEDIELQDEGEEGEYEFSIEIKDLKHMLKEGECVCGNKIEIGNDAYEKIEKLIEVIEKNPQEKNKNITSLRDELIIALKNINTRYPKTIKKDIQGFNQKMVKLNHDIEGKQIEISELELKLENLNIDFINERNKQIEKNKKLIETLTEENGEIKGNLKDYPSLIREYNQLINEAEQQQSEKNEYQIKRDFCEDIKNISKQIYDELADFVHKELEEKVTEEYKAIHWKDTYKRVQINSNFEVEIEKEDGSTISATDPSTGSQIVLALSFMAALNSLAGFRLPQIIDTPIASLSDDMRENVAKYLPKYMKDKQMVLLVMDSEYTGIFKTGIKDYVGSQYNLKFVKEENNEETIIEKVI